MIEQFEMKLIRYDFRAQDAENLLEFITTMTVNGVEYNTTFYIYPRDFESTFDQMWKQIGQTFYKTVMEHSK